MSDGGAWVDDRCPVHMRDWSGGVHEVEPRAATSGNSAAGLQSIIGGAGLAAPVSAAQDALACRIHAPHPNSTASPDRYCATHSARLAPGEPCPVAARVTRAVLDAESGGSR